MRERTELILKIVCGVLAGLLLLQLARLVIHANPLRSVRIPELPTLPASLDATNANKGSNAVVGKVAGTNATNSITSQKSGEKGTNSTTVQTSAKLETNSPSNAAAQLDTNSAATAAAKATNIVAGQAAGTNATNSVTTKPSGEKGTNSVASQASAKAETNSPLNSGGVSGTNSEPTQASKKSETNSASGQASDKTGTNASPGLASKKDGTNTASARTPGKAGPPPSQSQPGMTKLPDLPPIIQARIDKIQQSEILAPFPRRMPMALLGIAGKDAFLRAPSGQTGIVKVGDELGGIKLLQIGTNRVLVEQEGEKKELTIFSGLGSESLLPKPKPATNETIIKSK